MGKFNVVQICNDADITLYIYIYIGTAYNDIPIVVILKRLACMHARLYTDLTAAQATQQQILQTKARAFTAQYKHNSLFVMQE